MDKEKQIEEIYEEIKYGTGSYSDDARSVAEILYDIGYRKQSENTVEVIRCKDCRYFGSKDDNFYLRQCEGCGDINEPCGFCAMFGFCTNKNGYCYKGERREDDAK